MEKETDDLTTQLQELRVSLEKVQNQQTEDSRTITRQQKTTERYLAKRQMLLSRKDECNRNIRDLGVLPEEAFEKYTSEKLDRVRICTYISCVFVSSDSLHFPACQKTSYSQRRTEEVCPRQQEGFRAIRQLYEATRSVVR